MPGGGYEEGERRQSRAEGGESWEIFVLPPPRTGVRRVWVMADGLGNVGACVLEVWLDGFMLGGIISEFVGGAQILGGAREGLCGVEDVGYGAGEAGEDVAAV